MNVNYDINSAVSFVVNISMHKIHKFVDSRLNSTSGFTKAAKQRKCLDQMFKQAEFGMLKKLIQSSSYYDNGKYSALIKKLH